MSEFERVTNKEASSGCLSVPIVIAAIIAFALFAWLVKLAFMVLTIPILLLAMYAVGKSEASGLTKLLVIGGLGFLLYLGVKTFAEHPKRTYNSYMKM